MVGLRVCCIVIVFVIVNVERHARKNEYTLERKWIDPRGVEGRASRKIE